MIVRQTLAVAAALGALTSLACTTSDDAAESSSATTTSSTMSPTPSTAPTGPASPPPTAAPATTVSTPQGELTSTVPPNPSTTTNSGGDEAGQTIVRFTSGDTYVDVTIDADSPTTRDFLSMLPLTLRFEEFNGREKISYLPRPLETSGSPGSDPEDGDLIYFTPWGNLGFYYNASGIGYSDDVIHLGTYDASLHQLTQLEQQPVTVEIVG